MDFIKTTLIGGFLVVLPLGLLIVIVVKLGQLLMPIAEPIGGRLPSGLRFPNLVVVVILLFACFLVGLSARTNAGRGAGSLLEQTVLERVPGYEILRSLTRRIGNVEEGEKFAPALVEIEEALVPGFVVEGLADGHYTVFVPSAPTPAVGTIYVIAEPRVHLVDVSFVEAVRCVSSWGVGARKMHRAMRERETGPEA